jgi:hypothetical protein
MFLTKKVQRYERKKEIKKERKKERDDLTTNLVKGQKIQFFQLN